MLMVVAPKMYLDEDCSHSCSSFNVGYLDAVGRGVLQLQDVGDGRLDLQSGDVFTTPPRVKVVKNLAAVSYDFS